MKSKKRSNRRYEWILWDGIWDSHREEYCSWPTIEKVMNDTDNQIKVWQKKYDEMKAKYERCRDGKEKT